MLQLKIIHEKGFEALTKEPGIVGAVYFVRQFYEGHSDWTKKRQSVLAELRKNK